MVQPLPGIPPHRLELKAEPAQIGARTPLLKEFFLKLPRRIAAQPDRRHPPEPLRLPRPQPLAIRQRNESLGRRSEIAPIRLVLLPNGLQIDRKGRIPIRQAPEDS